MLSALGRGMLATCEALAERDGIALLGWEATVTGTVEHTAEGPMFTSIVLCVDLEIAGNVGRIAATLEDAKQRCLVINALRVPVVIETEIRTAEGIQIELPCTAPRDRERLAS